MDNKQKIAKLEEIVLYIKNLELPAQEEIDLNPKMMDTFIDEKVMWIDNNIKVFNEKYPENKIGKYNVFVLNFNDGIYYNNPFGIVKTDVIIQTLNNEVKNENTKNINKMFNGVACLGHELKNYKYVAYSQYSVSVIRIIDLRYLALFIVFAITAIIKELSK